MHPTTILHVLSLLLLAALPSKAAPVIPAGLQSNGTIHAMAPGDLSDIEAGLMNDLIQCETSEDSPKVTDVMLGAEWFQHTKPDAMCKQTNTHLWGSHCTTLDLGDWRQLELFPNTTVADLSSVKGTRAQFNLCATDNGLKKQKTHCRRLAGLVDLVVARCAKDGKVGGSIVFPNEHNGRALSFEISRAEKAWDVAPFVSEYDI